MTTAEEQAKQYFQTKGTVPDSIAVFTEHDNGTLTISWPDPRPETLPCAAWVLDDLVDRVNQNALLANVFRRCIQARYPHGANYINIAENDIRLDGIVSISDEEQATLLKTLPETDNTDNG